MTLPTFRWLVGCDIGGTFTDIVVADLQTREIHSLKVLTSQPPEQSIIDGIDGLQPVTGPLWEAGLRIIHGTTLVINSLIQRSGPRTALLTTAGFADTLEMRRHVRPEMYDVQADAPRALVPRTMVVELSERMTADGEVLIPLDEEEVLARARELVHGGAHAIAVGFLNSQVNPAHEARVCAIIRDKFPEIFVTASSEVSRVIGEYPRTNTAVANASVMPIVAGYLEAMRSKLRKRGLEGDVQVMFSNGGVAASTTAEAVPINMIESGPVGGVLGAVYWTKREGKTGQDQDFLSLDIGGTTAKSSLVRNGELTVAEEYEIDRSYFQRRRTGLPIAVPCVDITEVGMGGGSIAWIDSLGVLRVGPTSAGVAPGPASYGRGGERPTVTDADLVLGFLRPENFGSLQVSPELAARAVERHLCGPLKLDVEAAAAGVVEVANETMASATKDYVAERGADTAALTLVATGGAGPLHGGDVARRMGISTVLVPPMAAISAAMGYIVGRPERVDLAAGIIVSLEMYDESRVEQVRADLLREAFDRLDAADLGGDRYVRTGYDLLYRGQGVPCTIYLPDGESPTEKSLRAAFEEEYQRRYGRSYPDLAVDLTGLRVRVGVLDDAGLGDGVMTPGREQGSGGGTTRRAYSPATRTWVDFTVVRRDDLTEGRQLSGPCLVEDFGATILVDIGMTAVRSAGGSLIMTLNALEGEK